MSTYNIEMNLYDGSNYNQLYPQTLLNNVTDWSNNIYNKKEINNQISEINNEFSYTVKKTIIYSSSVHLQEGNTVALDLKISDLMDCFIIKVDFHPMFIYSGSTPTITLSGPTYNENNTYVKISASTQYLMLTGEESSHNLSLFNISQEYSTTWSSNITEESIIYVTLNDFGSSEEVICFVNFIGYTN